MTSLDLLKQDIMDKANAKIEQAERDYNHGANDCKLGVFDKWYRYNRDDDGRAYETGWVAQNKTTQNDTVIFLYDKN